MRIIVSMAVITVLRKGQIAIGVKHWKDVCNSDGFIKVKGAQKN